MSEQSLGFGTLAVHAGTEPDPATGARQVPIYQSTSYVFRDAEHAARLFNLEEVGYIYSRLTNPTVSALANRVAALEGGAGAICCSSGHAAQIMALFPLMGPGCNVVASSRLYGGTITQFSQTIKRFGWSATFVDTDDLDAIKAAINEDTRALFCETIANPGGYVTDLDAMAKWQQIMENVHGKAEVILGKQRHEVTHIPSLPYQRAPAFYQWLRTKPGVAALALRFLILTVARTSEVRLATFDEIEGDVWTLSPSRTKAGIEHKVPLTNEPLEIVSLARASTDGPYLFPSYREKPLSDVAMSVFMKREGYEARPHGFRATFRTWAEEQTETPFEVKESCLEHTVDNAIVQAYQRSDRLEMRRQILLLWTNSLLG